MDALPHLPIEATPDVLAAIEGIGRTEDVQFSPDGRRAAIAGFNADTVVLLDLEVAGAGDPLVTVTGCTTLHSEVFTKPHGVQFVDDLLLVASRPRDVTALRLPPPAKGVMDRDCEPVLTLDGRGEFKVSWPGSVRTVTLADGIHEAVVCNNYSHRLTRHLIDTVRVRSLRDEVLLAGGRLDIPDGVAFTNDGRWMAVSNHETKTVLVYDYGRHREVPAEPVATLHGVPHPHGLRFSADDATLLVAAGGSPNITVFERGQGWSGDHRPDDFVRVLTDETFALNNRNPGEGGVKGIDIHPSGRIVALASEAFPVWFVDARALVRGAPRRPSTRRVVGRRVLTEEMSRAEQLGKQLQNRENRIEVLKGRLRGREDEIRKRDRAIRERDAKIRLLEQWIGALREPPATPPSE